MKNKSLFSAFDSVSAKAFKQKIQFDLKGADYNDALLWESPEGINVKPYYHSDDTPDPIAIPGIPEQWHIGETLFIHDITKTTDLIHKAIQGGADTFLLGADAPFDIEAFYKGLPKAIKLHFSLNFLDASFYEKLYQQGTTQGHQIVIYVDLIGHLAKEGNWFHTDTEDHKSLEQLIKKECVVLSIDLSLYENAGANGVQQLAYSLAHSNEYLHFLNTKNLSEIPVHFNVSIGNNYFFEIAKLRALRIIYARLAEEYGFNPICTITATPSQRNKTLYDYNVNMLRTTTECMSAVLGGANCVVNLPYDAIYHKTNDFAQRIARNQLHILKKESYFDAVNNPADGTYYIEQCTLQLAQKALTLFKSIEQGGGFVRQLHEGTIQRKIKESVIKAQERFDKGAHILLGTNKHPNPKDRMKNDLELYPFVKTKPRKTRIEPIIPRRLAEKEEQHRLNQEV